MATINEGTSARVSFTVTDYTGAAVPVSNIATATLSLYDYDSRDYLGSLSGVDIKDYITESGVCTYYVPGTANVLVDESKAEEKHVFYVQVSGVGANPTVVTHEWVFYVRNLRLA